MMPSGRYYVGDLCYVMHPQWNEFCDITIFGNSVKEGEFKLKNGVRFATLCTKYGDGTYQDQYGNSYSVDAGLIGCIRVEDISDKAANLNFGHIVKFNDDFEIYSEEGILHFGHISIQTGNEDYQKNEYDYEDYEDYEEKDNYEV
jgi:hypothetical protein